MKIIKNIITLMLVFTLTSVSFAGGHSPSHHPSHNSPSHHHDNHHHHHHGHGYYSSSANPFWALLGITAFTTAVVVGANAASKKKKEKVVIEERYVQVDQDLSLSEEQQKQVRNIFDTNRERIIPLRDERNLKSIALEQEMEKENPSMKVIRNLENEISELSKEIYKIVQSTKSELQAVLSPAQYETIKNMQL